LTFSFLTKRGSEVMFSKRDSLQKTRLGNNALFVMLLSLYFFDNGLVTMLFFRNYNGNVVTFFSVMVTKLLLSLLFTF